MMRIKLFVAVMGISFIALVAHVDGQITDNKADLAQLSTEMKQAAKWAKYEPVRKAETICKVSQDNVQKYDTCDTQEQIEEEIRLGEMEELAQLIQAEAGNQDLKGKRLVADVVLNRLDDGWADTLDDIIHQKNQFATIKDGAFDLAAWNMTASDFEASEREYTTDKRLDSTIFFLQQADTTGAVSLHISIKTIILVTNEV